jgi:hypothetical protein
MMKVNTSFFSQEHSVFIWIITVSRRDSKGRVFCCYLTTDIVDFNCVGFGEFWEWSLNVIAKQIDLT